MYIYIYNLKHSLHLILYQFFQGVRFKTLKFTFPKFVLPKLVTPYVVKFKLHKVKGT